MMEKHYQQPVNACNWGRGNMLLLAHGDQVELMLWRVGKVDRKVGEELIN